jgi:hypothetical protein
VGGGATVKVRTATAPKSMRLDWTDGGILAVGFIAKGKSKPSAFVWAGLATLAMGALVEIGEGVSGRDTCRLRDLVPDSAGALLGAAIVFVWNGAREELRVRYGATSSRSSSSSR